MATAYLADNYLVPVPNLPYAGAVITREFLFTVTAALVINDTIKLGIIPGLGVCVLEEWYLDFPDLDSGGTPALDWDLGDDDGAATFLAQSTAGQAAAITSSAKGDGVKQALPVSYTANKNLILKVHTAPQTSATTGTIMGYYRYHMVGATTPV